MVHDTQRSGSSLEPAALVTAVAPEFSRSRAPLELEVLGGLARAEVVFELLEQRLDARPRELGVDAQLRVALLERVLPGLLEGRAWLGFGLGLGLGLG